MNSISIFLMLALSCFVYLGNVNADNNPVDEKWWPSEFGEADQAGGTNYITAEKRVAAAGLVHKGEVTTLGMPYHGRMPLFPGRIYSLTIPGGGNPTHDLAWSGEGYRQTFMDELVTAQIGQVGTQFDSLGHPMIKITGKQAKGFKDGNYLYNGRRLEDIGGPYGLRANGTENVGSFFTRGIIIDMVKVKGGNLPIGYAVTMEDYRAALKLAGIEDAGQGDVVLIRTGWNDLWQDNLTKTADQASADNAMFNSGGPGVSPAVCDHLASRKIAMMGADNWGIEPYDFGSKGKWPTPIPEIKEWGYCHMNLSARRGIYLFEN
ncbi:MAG: cyclase family protein, partial [Proteobacteria bacterium]|nr:cyclase family protein [Pseudomonadota bacterium]